jgi:hypothetical protein
MKLSDIESGLASGKLASELSITDWKHKLIIIKVNDLKNSHELASILHITEGEDRDCALCVKYVKSEKHCNNCPLINVDPLTCFHRDSYYGLFIRASNHNELVITVKNMISALEKAFEIEKRKASEEE